MPDKVKAANPNAAPETQNRAVVEILNLARQEFSNSYKTATDQLAQEQGQLSDRLGQLGMSFSDLISPSSNLSGIFPNLSDNSNNAATSVGNLAGQAESVASRLANIQFQPPRFGTINIPGINTGGGGQKPPVPKLAFQNPYSLGIKTPAHARGGIVEGDGFAYVHAGNAILPAKTTQGIRGINRLFAMAQDADARRSPTARLSNLIQVGRDADAARAQSTSIDSNNLASNSKVRGGASSDSIQFNLTIPMPIQGKGDAGLSAKEVFEIITAAFPGELKKAMPYIEHKLAKRKNRDVDRA